MQNNIIVRIALCGILAVAHITLAMDVTTEVNKNATPLYNGYYTNNFDSLPPQLPMYEYLKEQNLPKNANASEITYANTTNDKTNTVQFSGKNKSNELLIYNQEKYHVIIDSKGKDLFCIKMYDTPSPTSSNNSPISLTPTLSPRNNNQNLAMSTEILNNNLSSNQNTSVSPIDDYDCTRTPNNSLPNSQPNSPRKQVIGEVLGGEKEIIYEVVSEEILDNTGRTYQQPTPPSRDTIIGFFTNVISEHATIYHFAEGRYRDNDYSEITYQIDNENCKTIIIKLSKELDNQRYIAVRENVMGLIKQYVIDMHPETDPTNQNNEQSDNSTNNLISPEGTLENSLPKQQFRGYFFSLTEKNENANCYEGLTIKLTHEFDIEGIKTENITVYPGHNYQYEIEYINKTGNVCTAFVNCSDPLEMTETHIAIESNFELIIKLPIQEKTTQPTNSEKTSSEQITETNNNNNNNNNNKDTSSNLPTAGKLTQPQTYLSCFSRMPYNSIPNEYKQYDGTIIESNKQSSKVAFTDKNNIHQEVLVTGTAEGATCAIIKNSANKVVCVVKLPTPKNVIDADSQQEAKILNNDISKKSDFQRFNKNPNNRDPKYTVIGAAFLTICIVLAYKYDKLPTVLTKLFDGCIAQLHKLTPSHFKH